MRKPNLKTLAGLASFFLFLLGIASFMLMPFMLPLATAVPTFANTCGDTQTSCFSNVLISGDIQVGGNFFVTGSIVATTSTVTGANVLTVSNVAITTATGGNAFSVAGKNYISLSTNANVTAAYPTNAAAGQIVLIRAANGAGTDTITFTDNASTMSLGTNRVLTEGNNSIIELICTTGGARPQWASIDYQAN